jgi:hypothetical protein
MMPPPPIRQTPTPEPLDTGMEEQLRLIASEKVIIQYCREVKSITQREEAQEIKVEPAVIQQKESIA